MRVSIQTVHVSCCCAHLLPLDGLGVNDGLLEVAARRIDGDVDAAVALQHRLEQLLRLCHLTAYTVIRPWAYMAVLMQLRCSSTAWPPCMHSWKATDVLLEGAFQLETA